MCRSESETIVLISDEHGLAVGSMQLPFFDQMHGLDADDQYLAQSLLTVNIQDDASLAISSKSSLDALSQSSPSAAFA